MEQQKRVVQDGFNREIFPKRLFEGDDPAGAVEDLVLHILREQNLIKPGEDEKRRIREERKQKVKNVLGGIGVVAYILLMIFFDSKVADWLDSVGFPPGPFGVLNFIASGIIIGAGVLAVLLIVWLIETIVNFVAEHWPWRKVVHL
jgi:hypothetical protein